MTDEQLVTLARHGDEQAMGELARRHDRVLGGIAARYFFAGGDRDDVAQEALIGLYKAVRDFDRAAGIPFGAFAALCIRRQVITAVKTANRIKHRAVTFAVTGPLESETGEFSDVVDMLEAPNADPVELLDGRRRAHLILRVVADDLSDLERDVLVGFANGETYVDTALRLGFPVRPRTDHPTRARSKTVDNAIQRARRKIELALLEDERLPLGAAA